MTPRCKKRSTYSVIACFYLLGGIEYAVILPTVWLYLSSRFNAPSYFLGLMLSSFTLSGLFANPIMGIVSDRMRNTKMLFLFANLWEIAGNIMYFLGFNAWFLVCSRLVAGVGAGVGSPMTGDITRATTLEERTPILAVLGATRQFGLLLGPGFNLFLRAFNFHIGSFIVDKYTSPGLFMAGLWTLLNILVLFLYFELPALKDQESLTSEITYPRRLDSTCVTDSLENISVNSPLLDENYTTNEVQIVNNYNPLSPSYGSIQQPSFVRESVTKSPSNTRQHDNFLMPGDAGMTTSDEIIESAEIILSTSCPQRTIQERLYHQIDKNRRATSVPVDYTSSSHSHEISVDTAVTPGGDRQKRVDSVTDARDSSGHSTDENAVRNGHSVHAPLGPHTHRVSHQISDKFHIPLSYAIAVFTREEIVALLAASFIAFFNQVALETMFTPFTERLLGWKGLENSIFFCAAGVWILISFFTLRFLSKRLSDRVLLLSGYLMEMVAVSWLLYFIPTAVPGDTKRNLANMLVGVALDLFGLPFIIVTSTSIFSKITDEETQGFTQGVKSTVQGIGVLLGPLWAGSLLDSSTRIYIMLSVMLALMLFSLVLLLLSWRYLKERTPTTAPPSGRVEERQPLLTNHS